MAQPCATCEHPQVREINHRLRESRPLTDISRWLTEAGTPITRQALARHMKQHLGEVPQRGRRPVSGDFLVAVRDTAHAALEDGELQVTLRDGLQAQKLIDERLNRNADRDLVVKIGLILTGQLDVPRVLDAEIEAIEGEFRPLLTTGD